MIDPKITLHGDLVTAGGLIHAARVCLDRQLRQDAAYGRMVSKQRWALSHGAYAVVTHEYSQTYIQIVAPTASSSSRVTPRVPAAYVAFSWTNLNTAPWTTTLWLSRNGVTWREGPAVPADWGGSGISAVILPNERALIGSWDSATAAWALWLMDARTGAMIGTAALPKTINGQTVNGAPELLYLGNGLIWMAIGTTGGVWSGSFNTGAMQPTSFTLGQQLFTLPYSQMTYIPTYSQGGIRAGQTLADVFIVANNPVAGVSSALTQASSLTQPPVPLALPPYTLTSDVTLLVQSGPAGALVGTVNGYSSTQTESQLQGFVTPDILKSAWSAPITLTAALQGGAMGYHPNAGFAFSAAPPALSGGAGLFTSPDGGKWGAVPVPFWGGEVSFIFGPNGILIPEGTALLTTQGLQFLGPPAPFTTTIGNYFALYAGPNPQPWLNLYP